VSSPEQLRKAFVAARVYLEMRGFRVLEQNFRRPGAIIHIIAQKQTTVYFIEILYRQGDDEFESITNAISTERMRQLERGAAAWVQETKWLGAYRLASIEIAGSNYLIMGFIDNLL
jgi:Holliday junction resolvase-like predicted endonuclease